MLAACHTFMEFAKTPQKNYHFTIEDKENGYRGEK